MTMLLALVLHALSAASAIALPAVGTIAAEVNEVVREKREPQPHPSRSMTFSGFIPYGGGRGSGGGGGGGFGGGGLSAFASTADFGGYFPQPHEQDTRDHQGDDLQPPSEGEPSGWGKGDAGVEGGEGGEVEPEESEERRPEVPRRGKKNKKKHSPPKGGREGDEEEYERERPVAGRGGDAAATFNAWFPIMLGWGGGGGEYPGSGGSRGTSSGGVGGGGRGRGGEYPPASHTTVIANSVSNGRAGVAASHAVAYGGPAPQQERLRSH